MGRRQNHPNCTHLANTAQNEAELNAFLHSLDRDTPFGDPTLHVKAAKSFGLESSLQSGGRPSKER